MAIFGLDRGMNEPHQILAVRAAKEMLEALSRFNAILKERYNREFRTGVGLHTGPVIGDTVHTASRSAATARSRPPGTRLPRATSPVTSQQPTTTGRRCVPSSSRPPETERPPYSATGETGSLPGSILRESAFRARRVTKSVTAIVATRPTP